MNRIIPRLAVRVAPILMVIGILMLPSASASAAGPGAGWSIRALAQPTVFTAANNAACELGGGSQICDSYTVIVTNVGSVPASAGVTVADALPHGMSTVRIEGESLATQLPLACTTVPLQCVDEAKVPVGGTLLVTIDATLEVALEESGVPSVFNAASVAGGGAPAAAVSEHTPIGSTPAPFGIEDFTMQPFDESGALDVQAGGRPYTLATSLDFTTEARSELGVINYRPSEEVKDVIVNLPQGFVGDPQTTPRCPLSALLKDNEETACERTTRIGTIVFEASPGTFRASEGAGSETTALYNMVPEPGFPAEFGFTYLGKPVFMYASSVRIGSSYRLRVTVPGIPELQTIGVTLLFFGDPGQEDINSPSPTPFLTNPVDCSAGPLSASIEVDTWQRPSIYHLAETTAYPQVTGCNMLQFQPTLSVQPEKTQADEPSGYTFTVANHQNESSFTPGTPELRTATVTLPPGVSVSPAAGDGLSACAAVGPNGINIGSGETAIAGQDVGDPYATELGAGNPGGNGSPYDDGLYHTAPGHCPAASTVGTVEVETPLVPSPLQGHVYLAQPQCGGAGQEKCVPEDALNGSLFGIYLEASGSGSIIKLAGHVSIDPTTGQITTSVSENPQLPFSAFRLHFTGGPRAALANPQACGAAKASGVLSAWSAPATLDSTSLSSFTVDWDGAGGACPSTMPLSPSLVAETTNPAAGAYSPFTVTLSRSDRQQYFSQLSVTTPTGLLGMLSTVPLCKEPQAQLGECPAASNIGTVTAAAGSGSHPLWVSGQVYLTESYDGAPFGLSIVVPAEAGPFHLGNVNVRSAINVNPSTSALTITSGPLPQIVDGVPLRIQAVNVNVNRPNFMFNPTNCSAKQITAVAAGAQGALATVSVPFAAANCRSLPFSPSFKASTSARTSRKYGASFNARVGYASNQANIRSVAVKLPKQLPARLTTIQQACLEATFETNPATCPAGSVIGIAKAQTPVLPVPVEGPVYLVSHGGAAFPDVEVVLQGEGVRIDLTGNINIAKGITSSTFASVPDAPITSFELNLPLSVHSALGATGNLCAASLVMPTTLIGQNGAEIKQNTKITVGGCPKVKKKAKKKAKNVKRRAGKASRLRGGSR